MKRIAFAALAVLLPSRAAAIHGGRPAAEEPRVLSSTVLLVQSRRKIVCAAALVAPDLVLTAAHCYRPRARDFDARSWRAGFADGSSEVTRSVAVLDMELHSEFSRGDPRNPNDLALLLLAEPAPAGHSPVDTLKDSSQIGRVGRVIAAGAGYTPDDEPGDFTFAPLQITEITPEQGYFDATGSPDALGVQVCKGDSGGPAYITRPASLDFQLAGILSTGERGLCSPEAHYIAVSSYLDWIKKAEAELRRRAAAVPMP